MIAGSIVFGIVMTPTTQSSIAQELGTNDLIAARPRGWRGRVAGWKEYAVATAEMTGLIASPVFWGAKVRRGDGRSVLVIPGYSAGDIHLLAMRNWLERMGYRAVKSGI